jgi:hypothetical protein
MATSTVYGRRVLAEMAEGVSSDIARTTKVESTENERRSRRRRASTSREYTTYFVIEVHRNRNDGHVRSVKLKTATSVLGRPICKIVVLEGTQ